LGRGFIQSETGGKRIPMGIELFVFRRYFNLRHSSFRGVAMNHCPCKIGFAPRIHTRRVAFTLVELLVVIAIIGILVALLLPAIQAAREAARRTECKNHLHNLALGCLLHQDVLKFLPSGGWADSFTADANMGYGARQPGSWYFSVLAYIEQGSAHDLNKGLAVNPAAAGAQAATTALHTTPIPVFNCPSRRIAKVYPIVNDTGAPTWTTLKVQTWIQSLPAIIKGDYAGNAGDSYAGAGNDYGVVFTVPTVSDYPALAATSWNNTNKAPKSQLSFDSYYQTGVIYYRSEVSGRKIPDGQSKTYLIGEKFLTPLRYESASADKAGYGDNQGAYVGFEWDNERRAWNPDTYNAASPLPALATDENDFQPRQDTIGIDPPNVYAFGSAHAGSMNMAMCDGSVQSLSYDIDARVHHFLAVRFDGQAASLTP
jgi:prepilin-type N-terminal cleavage/methylation domain-containing protein/prepilin-type processing-associated H-X9-DG protein